MQSFAETIRSRLSQEHRSVHQAVAEGDVFDQDVHEAELEDLYRLALQNGVPVQDLGLDRSLLGHPSPS
jgi:hypothetical protein